MRGRNGHEAIPTAVLKTSYGRYDVIWIARGEVMAKTLRVLERRTEPCPKDLRRWASMRWFGLFRILGSARNRSRRSALSRGLQGPLHPRGKPRGRVEADACSGAFSPRHGLHPGRGPRGRVNPFAACVRSALGQHRLTTLSLLLPDASLGTHSAHRLEIPQIGDHVFAATGTRAMRWRDLTINLISQDREALGENCSELRVWAWAFGTSPLWPGSAPLGRSSSRGSAQRCEP